MYGNSAKRRGTFHDHLCTHALARVTSWQGGKQDVVTFAGELNLFVETGKHCCALLLQVEKKKLHGVNF